MLSSSSKLIVLLSALSLHQSTVAFTAPAHHLLSFHHKARSPPHNVLLHSSKTTNNPVEITFPTPNEAASMGIRDWPQTFHKTSWSESISEGQIATRYVLDGNGRVNINYFDNNGREASRKDRVYPGTLVEVDGEATLNWEVDGDNGMIILTPGFEEGGKLALVLGFFVVFCAGLLAGSGGF
jgi:hypothetical protein